MDSVFLKLLNMSITATWVVLAVILLRLLLKKAPKAITVFLWALVAFRLICPFSLESAVSLIPSAETVPSNITVSDTPEIHSGISALNSAVNPVISDALAPNDRTEAAPMQTVADIASLIWVIGMAAMIIYTVISYLRIYLKVREAVPLDDNIRLCDGISAPFAFGAFRPRIYIPSDINEGDIEYIAAHERAHIKRLDHLWKPLGFLLLTVYWFNPFLWIAYVLLCRDIELACDEKVIRDMGSEIKKPYSEALINCSVPRKMISACPLAFGDVGVKTRVKSVLSYKKPAFWVIIAAALVCVALTVCFLTNPIVSIDREMHEFICDELIKDFHSKNDNCAWFIDCKVLGTDKNGSETTVYMVVMYEEYSNENGLKNESGAHIPTVVKVKQENGKYTLTDIREPRDGSYYADDIRDMFPGTLRVKALNSPRYAEAQKKSCMEQAKKYFSSISSGDTVVSDANEAENKLRKKYPQYFDLPAAAKGLEVYVWQTAPGSYYFGLLPGRNAAYSIEELMQLDGASVSEMRIILNSYDIPAEDIVIIPINQPYSSYIFEPSEEYVSIIEKMLWDEDPEASDEENSLYISSAFFDIDGDGITENCTVGYGPTSGISTYTISAYENGELEYFNIFMINAGDISFKRADKGKTVLCVESYEGTQLFDISVDEGNIVLSSKGESAAYWGERHQGISSDFAPRGDE